MVFFAMYSFESDYGHQGVFAIDKSNGGVNLIKAMPGDEKLQCYYRASIKVMREWRNGKLPEMLEWAS